MGALYFAAARRRAKREGEREKKKGATAPPPLGLSWPLVCTQSLPALFIQRTAPHSPAPAPRCRPKHRSRTGRVRVCVCVTCICARTRRGTAAGSPSCTLLLIPALAKLRSASRQQKRFGAKQQQQLKKPYRSHNKQHTLNPCTHAHTLTQRAPKLERRRILLECVRAPRAKTFCLPHTHAFCRYTRTHPGLFGGLGGLWRGRLARAQHTHAPHAPRAHCTFHTRTRTPMLFSGTAF